MEVIYNNSWLHGRRLIRSDAESVGSDNILDVLNDAIQIHEYNRNEIQYLYDYYKNKTPILDKEKIVRPEINEIVSEGGGRAYEIVSFKTGYLMGEPIQYVYRGSEVDEGKLEQVNRLNDFVFAEEKASKDKELVEWMHICGTGYRFVASDPRGEEDYAPFEIHTLDPRRTFVVYRNSVANEPLLGVTYTVDRQGIPHYFCYSDNEYWVVSGQDGKHIAEHSYTMYRDVPIIEYPLTRARMGSFENVLTLLDTISTVESDRADAITGSVNSLLLFHNVDLSSEDYEALREQGALKFRDIDPQFKGSVSYISPELSQSDTQVIVDHLYDTVLTVCGIPNRNKTSSGDNGLAVIYRDGYTQAEARAKDTELMFKKSERVFLRLVLNICDIHDRPVRLRVSDVEIRFTRRNYENILQKAQVLQILLSSGKVAPRLAFEHCGMFADPDLAWTVSAQYEKEQTGVNGIEDDRDNAGNGGTDGEAAFGGPDSGAEGGERPAGGDRDNEAAEAQGQG